MTGLIYVAIVALWAAVLIPMWLRRHDDGEAHRLERHQEAMGILARFRNGGTADWTPARRAARRRRTILATLLAVTVTGAAAWVLQVAGAWVVIVPGLVLLAFVASAAWATRAESTRERGRDQADATGARQASDRDEERMLQRAQQREHLREQRREQRRQRVAAARETERETDRETERETERDGYPHERRRGHRTEVIVTPSARTERDRAALEGTDIDQVEHDREAPPQHRRRAWDQVFDQTA